MEPNLAESIYIRSSLSVLTFLKFDEKRAITSRCLMGNQIYFKIAGYVDLDMLNMFAV
jgi:hypothetical protein